MSISQDPIDLFEAVLDTPALLLDLDRMEANIAHIARVCRERGVTWRPHVKVHKSPEIAQKELDGGAIGITCAKLGEAEVMAAAGIRNILIANQIVGSIKIGRLVELLNRAEPIVAIDSSENISELAAAMQKHGKILKVVIEVNVGMNRAGVEPGASAVMLANEVARHGGLRLVGLMAWESHAVTLADPAEKSNAVARAIGRLTATAEECRKLGHSMEIVSCGGTGTFPYCVQQRGVTEVQIGGGIFSDEHYRTHYHIDIPCALTLLATVTSRPTPTRIILDAGKKAMSSDAALPRPLGLPGVSSLRLSAEHATIELAEASAAPRVGDRLQLVLGYSDTTIHLHEQIVALRRGRVEAVWNVAARGKIK